MSKKDTLTVVSDRYSYGEDNPPGTPIEMDRKDAQRLIDSGMMRAYQEPKRARAVSAPSTVKSTTKAQGQARKASSETLKPIQINVASKTAIADGLKGIGDKLAATIVEVRSTEGAFEYEGDLLSVEGITQKMLDDNQGLIDYYMPPDVVEPE